MARWKTQPPRPPFFFFLPSMSHPRRRFAYIHFAQISHRGSCRVQPQACTDGRSSCSSGAVRCRLSAQLPSTLTGAADRGAWTVSYSRPCVNAPVLLLKVIKKKKTRASVSHACSMPEKRCTDVILAFIFLTGLVWKRNQISHVVEKVLLGSKLPLLDQRCKEMTTGIPVVHLLALRLMPEGAFPPNVPKCSCGFTLLPRSTVDYANQANGVVGFSQLRRGKNTNWFL